MTAYDGGKLQPPTESDLLRSLRSAVGDPEAELCWAQACLRARVRRGSRMNSADFVRAAEELIPRGGLIAVYARSAIIRSNTHKVLAGRGK